ncbi:MAG: aspartyl protease family protein [Caulobacter sp.]|nr:aspartyl protease family protein [Caulobacter sp.]
MDRRTLLIALAASPLAGPALAQSKAIVAPIRLANGRVLIDALINGQGPYPFAIDTGAVVSGVDQALAEELGLPLIRKVNLAKRPFDLFKASELVLGGAVRQQDAALFGFKLNLGGARGLIAAGLLTSFDSTLDFERQQWRVYPDGGGERAGDTRLASWFRTDPGANGSRRIGVEVTLDGNPLKLVVDTGAPRAVILEREVGRRLGYWNESRPFAPMPTSRIDGLAPKPARSMRGDLLQVGDIRFERPIVTVEDRRPIQGGFDGILGLPVLEAMNLSVDTREQALWVRSSGRPVWRERLSRTGLWIDETPGGVKVSVVGVGSPAQAAGLKAGDRITGGSFRDILGLLRADQAPITLQVEGRGAVTLIPADYI